MLDAILAGVVVLDASGRVEQMNVAACRILDLSEGALVGSPVERLLGPDHAIAALGRKVLESGVSASQTDQWVERLRAPDVPVDLAASPLFGDDDQLEGVVLVIRDQTLQRRLQQLEGERRRYESFGRIAAGLAHEVKNPLGGIRGGGELVARRSDDEKTREIGELIVREASRIADLVDDFMVFARGDELSCQALNLHQLLDEVLDLLALDPVSHPSKVQRLYDPSLPELLGDPNRLTQVFLNLARNALQAMQPGGGTLTIRTRMSLDHRMATGRGRPVPTVAIGFEDTGPGMPSEVLSEATTPFFTTRPGGTGLGLAVAEYWTSQHGGTLELESPEGQGARVHVILPLRRDP